MTDQRARLFHVIILVCTGLMLGYVWGRLVLPGCGWDCTPAHSAIVDGTAASPYRYRILTPLAVEAIAVLFDQGDPEVANHAAYFLGHLLALPALLLAVYFWLARNTSRPLALVGALLLGAYLPLTFITAGSIHLYTFVEIAIVAGALLLLYSSLPMRQTLYAVLTVIAVLNRETGIYLVLLYAAVEYHRPGFTWRLPVLAFIGAGTYVVLRQALGYAAHDVTLPYLLEMNLRYGAANVLHMVLMLPFAAAAILGYRHADATQRRLVWLSLPYALAVLVFGQWFESRLWFPLFPVLLSVGLPDVVEVQRVTH